MKILFTTAAILVLGAISVNAQSRADVQPVPASKDAVITPAAATAPVSTDTVVTIPATKAETGTSGQAPESKPDEGGQPAGSVRKPD